MDSQDSQQNSAPKSKNLSDWVNSPEGKKALREEIARKAAEPSKAFPFEERKAKQTALLKQGLLPASTPISELLFLDDLFTTEEGKAALRASVEYRASLTKRIKEQNE